MKTTMQRWGACDKPPLRWRNSQNMNQASVTTLKVWSRRAPCWKISHSRCATSQTNLNFPLHGCLRLKIALRNSPDSSASTAGRPDQAPDHSAGAEIAFKKHKEEE